jgi:hypothetical protein
MNKKCTIKRVPAQTIKDVRFEVSFKLNAIEMILLSRSIIDGDSKAIQKIFKEATSEFEKTR